MTRFVVCMICSICMAIIQYKMADYICTKFKQITFYQIYLTIIVAMSIGFFMGLILNSINI